MVRLSFYSSSGISVGEILEIYHNRSSISSGNIRSSIQGEEFILYELKSLESKWLDDFILRVEFHPKNVESTSDLFFNISNKNIHSVWNLGWIWTTHVSFDFLSGIRLK